MSDWFEEGQAGGACDVVAMLDGRAGDLLHEVAGSGALVSLGTTGDGGALGVTITVDGRWRREYFRDAELLGDWLAAAAVPVRQAVDQARAARTSSGQRGRRKGL